ncbi:MAG: hypothetical protein KC766_06820 [Myxococcales bacterium]|nr:hypothetical protein [Myxococcales bacterium]
MSDFFKLCSSCKKPIGFEQSYYACSVSTCNRKRTGLFFCSLPCWEAHLPMMRHRDAWAEQVRSPSRAEFEREQAEDAAAQERAAQRATPEAQEITARNEAARHEAVQRALGEDESGAQRAARLGVVKRGAETMGLPEIDDKDLPQEILIVASKLKKYVRARSDFNTSDGVMSVLSDHLRRLSVEAIKAAAREGRKTVLDRDILSVLNNISYRS